MLSSSRNCSGDGPDAMDSERNKDMPDDVLGMRVVSVVDIDD